MVTRGNTAPMFYRILARFPPNVSFSFAYVSGVKKQLSYAETSKKPMIDLIICVDNAHRWHTSNLERNQSDYSAFQFFGSKFITTYQEHFGANVFFNTLIPIEKENVLIKYGVVSTKDLIMDLTDWRHLYLAGRLHKPVEFIKCPSTKIQNALDHNLQSAVHAALLLLPEKFTDFDFFYKIASLSYSGDFRMIFGENPNKVRNIVQPQMENFKTMYAPTLKKLERYVNFPIDHYVCSQDVSQKAILHHLNSLPKWPIRRIVARHSIGRNRQDTEDILINLSKSSNCKRVVEKSLNDIVWQSSISQSVKNIPTAGLEKAVRYSWAKVLKMFGDPGHKRQRE
jgi:translocator assembly and maintenance protein 41